MTKIEIEKALMSSPMLNDFISGSAASLSVKIGGVDAYVYKENCSNVSLYYKIPYSENKNYCEIYDFIKYAIPILVRMLEDHDANNLMADTCLKGKYTLE